MQNSTPLHGASYVKFLVEELHQLGFSDRQIFENTGLSLNAISGLKPIVAFGKIAALFENAARLTGNDIVGLELGLKSGIQRIGLISYVGTASPTVLDFIRNIARYRRVFSDALEMDVSRLEQSGWLSWHFRVPYKISRRQHVEFSAVRLISGLRKITNRQFFPIVVEFSHLRNTNLAEITRAFGCEVRFGCSENRVRFKLADLDLPLMTADNELYAILIEHCELVLQRKSRNVSGLVVDVERAIADRLSAREATQDIVARSMGMSTRTLARRLANEQTTFFKTVESLRQSLAEGYLEYSDFGLAEIAFLLGYSGLSSFNDAFKRWTGKTPGQYRTA